MTDFQVGQLLRIFIGAGDAWHGRPLQDAILELLQHEGLAGASVFRGIEGFGADHQIRVAKPLGLRSSDLPIVIEVVDSAEKIGSIIPRLQVMVYEGTMTLERVEYWTPGKR